MNQEETNKTEHQTEDIEFVADSTNSEEEMDQTAKEISDHQQNENETTNEESILKLQSQVKELEDKYLRLYSEFENYKRRTTKERADWIKTSNQEMIVSLLPVLDDFERSMKAIENSTETSLKTGVELVQQKLKTILSQKGLKEMEAIGHDFDSEFHEAITKVKASDEALKDKIVDVLEKGYSLNDKVIRFAKVVIGE